MLGRVPESLLLLALMLFAGCGRSSTGAGSSAGDGGVDAGHEEQRKRIQRELEGRTTLDPALVSADISNLLDMERELVLPARVNDLKKRLAATARPLTIAGEYQPHADLGFGAKSRRGSSPYGSVSGAELEGRCCRPLERRRTWWRRNAGISSEQYCAVPIEVHASSRR